MKLTAEMSVLEGLKLLYPDSSNAHLRSLLKHKRVLVDGEVVVKGEVYPGQTISIGEVDRHLPRNIKILFEDRSLLVIDKPSGLLSVPLDAAEEPNALEIARQRLGQPHIYPVHRLDRDASGVMVFTKGKETTKRMNFLFHEHALERIYIAIVAGRVQEDAGTWTSYLTELTNYRVVSQEHAEKGKQAITHFEVIRRTKLWTILRLKLETGRKHQIRVHCKEAGHLIAGDLIYGNKECNPLGRLCLHATTLAFTHPFTQKKLLFHAPLPRRFKKIIN